MNSCVLCPHLLCVVTATRYNRPAHDATVQFSPRKGVSTVRPCGILTVKNAVQTVVLSITCRSPLLPTPTSNMKVSTSSLISSSVRGSPFCDVCSSKSRKFMCRLLPRIKKEKNVFLSFPYARVYMCVYTYKCMYIHLYVYGNNPFTHSGHCIYHQFNIQQFYVLPTQCIYVFCVDLRTNSDYFPIQH